MDQTYTLNKILSDYETDQPVPSSSSSLSHAENCLLGEFQFAFIVFLLGKCIDCCAISCCRYISLGSPFILKVRFLRDGINGDGFSPFLQTVKPVSESTHGSTKPS